MASRYLRDATSTISECGVYFRAPTQVSLRLLGVLYMSLSFARWTMNALADISFELRKQPMAVVWIRLETGGNVEVTSKIPWLCGRRFATPTVTTGTRWAITIDSGHDR
jgi:hypothetical protein